MEWREGLFEVLGWLAEKLDWWSLLLWVALALLLAMTLRTARKAIRGSETGKFDWAFPVKGRWLGYGLAAFALLIFAPAVGIPAGALAHSLFTLGAYLVLQPATTRSGEFGWIYMVTVPLGAVMGAGLGISAALWGLGWKRGAAGGLIVTGAGLILFSWVIALATSNSFRELITLPSVGSPVGWGAVFILAGLISLRRQLRRPAPAAAR